jgi:hypothetical protein
MQCKCGFENAADARFCGNCRSALGDVPVGAAPNATAPPAATPVAAAVARVPARPISRVHMAIVAAVVVALAAGYWWMNRPPGRYKPDNSGLYRINVDGKIGFMDRSGKTVITPQFDLAGEFSEGLAAVRVGTKSGYINTKGAVVITPQFDEANPFRYGRAAVRLGNRFGFIDKDGKYISSPDFSWAGQFSGDLAPVRTADGVMAFVNRSGKLELAGKVDSLMPFGFTEGLAPAGSGGKWGFIDTTGKWIIDPQFERAGNFADGLAPVVVGGRMGYIDSKGKFAVNPQYDFGDEFYEGLAVFTSGAKMGFIDTKGRVVTDARFLAAAHFSDGLAAVKTEDGWGFIDRTGKMAVRPKFDSASMFQNGLALVTVGGKEAYVTTAGAFVIDPFPGRSATPAHAEQLNPSASPTVTPSTGGPARPQQAQVEAYNDFNYRGNVAAQNSDFEKAIALWQEAIPLDPSPVVKCRGEFQRNSIRAANDTISMLRQRKLQPAEAPKWFTNHSTELWMPNACNSN